MFFLQLTFSGMCLGAVYALVAHGFNITFATSKVVNFAHGPFLMIGVMLTLTFLGSGLPMALAIILGLASTAVLGYILERVSVRPLLKSPTSMGWVVSTLGAGIILQAFASEVWGVQAIGFPAYIFESTDYVRLFNVQISLQLLMIFLVSLAIMVIFEFLLGKTLWGKAFKATARDSDLARLMGIKTKMIVSVSFMISTGLAALAGVMLAPVTGVDPAFGMDLMIKGFIAAVIGGMGSSKGAVAGGITLGVLEMLVGGYISTIARNGLAFVALITMLAVRPNGIFGSREVVKV